MLKFITKSLTIISFIYPVNGFVPWNSGLSNYKPYNIPYIKANINPDIKVDIKADICPEYIEKYAQYLNNEQSEFIVKKITGILPQVDSVAGYVLHTNDVLINEILNNNMLDVETKKSLVLFFIKLTLGGDAMGSELLQWYHDLVQCLL